MRYYLGPWVRQTEGNEQFFAPPIGVVGSLDLAPVPVQAVMADHRPVGLFVTSAAVLPSEYTLIGEGDCREMLATSAMQDAFRSLVGYRPQGDRLVDLIYDALTTGSDPRGENGPKPLVPTMDGWCDVFLPGHSKIIAARFEWGKSDSRGRSHWTKVKQLLRDEFAELFTAAKAGRLKDGEQHRRVLDFWCEKYRLNGADDWKELVPQNLQKDVPGRLKHETTYTDAFTRADSTGLGASWAAVTQDMDVVSNQARGANGVAANRATVRYESDLSSADHYSQADIVRFESSTGSSGACCRFASAAETFYAIIFRTGTSPYRRLFKFVAGASTLITSDATLPAVTFTGKISANGSTITAYYNGTSFLTPTDTSISGGTRGGMYGASNPTAGNRSLHDNFEAADLAASGLLYTQLERGTRGVKRGMYTKWG